MTASYCELLMVIDHLIDEEVESGWERTLEMSAFNSIEEFRNTQQAGSNVIDAAKALKSALVLQHRIEAMTDA
jgi:hypothetical protein